MLKNFADFYIDSYSYNLPEYHIAQHPASKRDQSRLLALNPQDNSRQHLQFADISDYITAGDLLIVNNTKVFPARFFGQKESGGKVEVFLLEFPKKDGHFFTVYALIRASKRPKLGSTLHLGANLDCTVIELLQDGKARLQFSVSAEQNIFSLLEKSGQVPLPPYIKRKDGTTDDDRQRYQTVYAQKPGAVAAPTAGLHFTPELLDTIRSKGAEITAVTLHVGYGTFAPIRVDDIRQHQIHSEYFELDAECAEKINRTKKEGGKIWAVGTTAVRTLEFATKIAEGNELQAASGWCDLYIYPGFEFQIVDNLITNFHLPNSSLMFLVSAFCGRYGQDGREMLLSCYNEAVAKGYRFFSYGDAMAIISPRT